MTKRYDPVGYAISTLDDPSYRLYMALLARHNPLTIRAYLCPAVLRSEARRLGLHLDEVEKVSKLVAQSFDFYFGTNCSDSFERFG